MFYRLLRKFFLTLFTYLCRYEVKGLEHIPPKGPAVIIANHTSYWDPIVLGVVSPRPLFFMAKAELFKIPVFSSIIRALKAFPVDRKKSDRAALKAGMDVLDRGDILAMFPEGTRFRDGKLGEFKLGAVMIAAKRDAPLIPVALVGTPQIFSKGFFRPFTVIIGEPIRVEKLAGEDKITSAALQKTSDTLRDNILETLQESWDFYRN